MKKKWKIVILLTLLVLVAGGVFASIKFSERGVVTVQTGRVTKADLTAVVTASGEIKPRNYINIGANTQGPVPITTIYVKEGDRVKKGQVLARLANVQPSADLRAEQASLNASLADSAASEAAQKSSCSRPRSAVRWVPIPRSAAAIRSLSREAIPAIHTLTIHRSPSSASWKWTATTSSTSSPGR